VTECNGCGDCCRVVTLSADKAAMRKIRLEPSNRRWIDRDLQRLSGTEARRLLPSLPRSSSQPYYRCRWFNYETSRCDAYDQRPPICTGFPFYGHEPAAKSLGSRPRCSFWADVPREEWPAGFVPVESIV
jgi:Fe-S-cluster containining protein